MSHKNVHKKYYQKHKPTFFTPKQTFTPKPVKLATSIYDFFNLSNLGSGAFANVYKGHELIALTKPPTYREVALKRIHLAAITDPAIYKTTMNEVKVFKTLTHPNIVQCYRSFEEISPYSHNKYLVLVLEYINGGDLQSWIQERAINKYCLLPESEIWYIFVQIADAVNYIHSKRIIHRDLKPPNVLLNYDGIVKLADFGLSRLNLAVGVEAQTVCGTPYYMSPERIIEQPYSFASDIWSLGCILYEMAALKSPFFAEKENVQSLIQKIRSADFPPIPEDCYCEQLDYLIESCMNPNMEKRPKASEVYMAAKHMNNLWIKHLNNKNINWDNENEEEVSSPSSSSAIPSTSSSTNTVIKQNEASELEGNCTNIITF